MKAEIKTPRGTFKVERVFTSEKEAKENGYGFYFTNDDGTDIYTYHIDQYHCKFAIISKKSLLKTYFFTFGSSEQFPFQCGWVEVLAPNMVAAQQIFRIYYPDIVDYPDRTEGVLNCANYYTEDEFKKTKMYKEGNMGYCCHIVIGPKE
mgnify:FL=1